MKNKFLIYILLAMVFTVANYGHAYAQSRSNTLIRPCGSTTNRASIGVSTAGAISLTMCPGQAMTANNAAGDSEFRMSIIPSSTVGNFSVGDFLTTPLTYLTIDQTTTTSTLSGGTVRLGDYSTGGGATRFTITDSTGTFLFGSGSSIFDLTGILTHRYLRTVTTGGTSGAQTINRPAGTVNFAAAATAVVVTNSTVSATSIVFAVLRTNDATCNTVRSVVPAAGSFTINLNAGCTAEASVGFFVTN